MIVLSLVIVMFALTVVILVILVIVVMFVSFVVHVDIPVVAVSGQVAVSSACSEFTDCKRFQ